MRYTPRTEEDDEQRVSSLLPPGTYDAVVAAAEEKVSKSGNSMIELVLKVYTNAGTKNIYDYLVASDGAGWKIRHFCRSAGLNYETGELDAAQCVDRNVRVELIVKHQAGYSDKNAVTDYAERANGATPQHTGSTSFGPDEDIPF